MCPVRRPSVVAQYAAQVAEWLRENPAPSAVEILRRVRLVGYHGGKSALYELVRRVRTGAQQQIIVVARDRLHLFNVFTQAFEGNTTVRVVPDRRVADRRQRSDPPVGERRKRNRRSALAIEPQLHALGWAIVRLPTRGNRRSPAS